jgi:catechol 2,3-dioxygenase-like lactoylglutathione lyase family enzyme
MQIRGLHHNAYRCRDSEETRKFCEDFLGLPLVNAFEITDTKPGRKTRVLHRADRKTALSRHAHGPGEKSRAQHTPQ